MILTKRFESISKMWTNTSRKFYCRKNILFYFHFILLLWNYESYHFRSKLILSVHVWKDQIRNYWFIEKLKWFDIVFVICWNLFLNNHSTAFAILEIKVHDWKSIILCKSWGSVIWSFIWYYGCWVIRLNCVELFHFMFSRSLEICLELRSTN